MKITDILSEQTNEQYMKYTQQLQRLYDDVRSVPGVVHQEIKHDVQTTMVSVIVGEAFVRFEGYYPAVIMNVVIERPSSDATAGTAWLKCVIKTPKQPDSQTVEKVKELREVMLKHFSDFSTSEFGMAKKLATNVPIQPARISAASTPSYNPRDRFMNTPGERAKQQRAAAGGSDYGGSSSNYTR